MPAVGPVAPGTPGSMAPVSPVGPISPVGPGSQTARGDLPAAVVVLRAAELHHAGFSLRDVLGGAPE